MSPSESFVNSVVRPAKSLEPPTSECQAVRQLYTVNFQILPLRWVQQPQPLLVLFLSRTQIHQSRLALPSIDDLCMKLLHPMCNTEMTLTKGEVKRATKLLQFATKTDFNNCYNEQHSVRQHLEIVIISN